MSASQHGKLCPMVNGAEHLGCACRPGTTDRYDDKARELWSTIRTWDHADLAALLRAVAEEARAEEREACALMLDEPTEQRSPYQARLACIARIRARGKP